MTPAEELRAAAAKIRERAGRACGRPWRNRDGLIEGNGARVATAAIAEGHDSADHIALWHPGVAMLVADWLDAVAVMWDGLITDASRWGFLKPEGREALRSGPWDAQHALALARAVNGGPEAFTTQPVPNADDSDRDAWENDFSNCPRCGKPRANSWTTHCDTCDGDKAGA